MINSSPRSSRITSVFLVGLMMLTGVFTANPVLAAPLSITSQRTGVVITYDSPFTLDQDATVIQDGMEFYYFEGPTSILLIGFLPVNTDLNAARDLLLGTIVGEDDSTSIQNIDKGSYTGVSYSLDMVTTNGVDMGTFSLFMDQEISGRVEMYVLITSPETFLDQMQSAQSSVQVGGQAIFSGVDASSLANQLNGNAGVTQGDGTTSTRTSRTSRTSNSVNASTHSADPADSSEYLNSVTSIYDDGTAAIGAIFDLLQQLNDGADANSLVPQLQEAYDVLGGILDRANALTAPTGMEDFHQTFLDWATSVTAASQAWNAALAGQATFDDAIAATMDTATPTGIFGEILQMQVNSATTGTSGSNQNTSRTSRTSRGSTDVTGKTNETPGSNAEAYVQGIRDQQTAFLDSFATFNGHFEALPENATDEQLANLRTGTTEEAEYWLKFEPLAKQQVPPAGYEAVQEAYENWSMQVTELGNLWIGFVNGDGTTTEDFTAQLVNVNSASSLLDAALAVGDQNVGNATTPTPDTSGSTTTRTSRLGQNSTIGTDPTVGGNTWVTPIHNVTISWNDDFTLTQGDTPAQQSDPDQQTDRLYLTHEDDLGDQYLIMITVFPNPDGSAPMKSNALDLWTDPASLHEDFSPDAVARGYTVNQRQAAVLIQATLDGEERWIYTQFTCVTDSCDTQAMLFIIHDGAGLPNLLQLIADGVSVEGINISGAMPASDVEDLISEFGQ